MSRAQRELDRMSAEAWRGLGIDAKRAGGHLKQAGAACAKEHPVLVICVGALLAGVAAWRLVRPARAVVAGAGGFGKLRGLAWNLLRVGGLGVARAFVKASVPSIKPGAGESNGQTRE